MGGDGSYAERGKGAVKRAGTGKRPRAAVIPREAGESTFLKIEEKTRRRGKMKAKGKKAWIPWSSQGMTDISEHFPGALPSPDGSEEKQKSGFVTQLKRKWPDFYALYPDRQLVGAK